MRKIKVTDDTFSSMKVIESEAITLDELKAELTSAGIEYDGKEFIEGRSRTKLIEDGSLLPTQVMYKGQPTDELTIVLLTPNKKVSSGISRKELNAKVKELGIEELIKERFGRNYTQVTSHEIQNLIAEIEDGGNSEPEEEFEPVDAGEMEVCIVGEIKDMECETKPEEPTTGDGFIALLECLYMKGIISKDEKNLILEGKIPSAADMKRGEDNDELEELKSLFKRR